MSESPSSDSFFLRCARSRAAMGWLVVALALTAYGNTIFSDFAFDDLKTIRNNPLLKSPRFWRDFASRDYFWMSGESTWRPLVTLSNRLDYALYGAWAGGYHLSNLLLHALNAWLAYWIVQAWNPLPAWGAVAGAIVAAHPAGTEAVNGVSFREDLLAATFMLLSWLALRRGAGGDTRPAWMAAASALFLFACLSKESGLALVPLAAAGARAGLLAAPAGRRMTLRQTLVALNWLMPAALVYIWIWGWGFANPSGAPQSYLGGSRLAAIYNIPRVYAHHLPRLLGGIGLSADYGFEAGPPPASLEAEIGMIVFIVALCVIAGLFEKAPRIGFGLLWIVIALAPVSNIAPLHNPVADRFLYLPLIGLGMAAAGAAEAAWRRAGEWREPAKIAVRRGLLWAGGLCAVWCLLATSNRNLAWSSDERLWTETAKRNGDSWRVLYRLGDIYRAKAQEAASWQERESALNYAAVRLRKAKELAPYHPDVRVALGNVYLMQGRLDDAIAEYRSSLARYPRNPTAAINLSQAYFHKGQFDYAAWHLARAEALGFPVEESFKSKILEARRKAHSERLAVPLDRLIEPPAGAEPIKD